MADQETTIKGRPRPFPPQATPFLGREHELSEVIARLRDPDCRLLSLIGPGGIGKTRLAMEVSARLEGTDEFPDGVHLVPLQSVAEGDHLASAIAESLEIGLSGAEDPSTQVLNYLRDKKLLLVLDNVEQLVDEDGLGLISKLIQIAPRVKLLTTSRRVLQLSAEWRYPIQGLPVPAQEDIDGAESFDAVKLFIASAQRVQPDFKAED
ncbi:MAG: ATP-binding protein, partial [Anaerolineales bacterium]